MKGNILLCNICWCLNKAHRSILKYLAYYFSRYNWSLQKNAEEYGIGNWDQFCMRRLTPEKK